jgi:hypothetical protein
MFKNLREAEWVRTRGLWHPGEMEELHREDRQDRHKSGVEVSTGPPASWRIEKGSRDRKGWRERQKAGKAAA